MSAISHFDLCKATAEWAVKKYNAWVCLYDYQSFASGEFPDVLSYNGSGTILFEIKVSRSDFLQDGKKVARKKWKPKVSGYRRSPQDDLRIQSMAPELYYIEAPHLGTARYYVCPVELIQPEEVPEGWGLYWWVNGRFFLKKNSKKWRPDVHTERNLIAHAFRRSASGDSTGILVRTYEVQK